MSPASHRPTSLGWQIGQGWQRLTEWGEYQLAKLNFKGPDLPSWPWLAPLGQVLFWLLTAALILGIAWMLYQTVLAYQRQRGNRTLTTALSPAEPALKPAIQWWREAQRLAQQGDYRGACTALYMAGLLHLSESQTVPYGASRTDGEYLRRLPPQAPSRPYELLIRTHERLTFGQGQATAETYQRCRRAYEEIVSS
ncbi:MAG: DUF4129 domain-containing protein [Nodosilinea sp.]